MADEKKYYWLKLKKDFFKRHDTRLLEKMSDGRGKEYLLFYLKLMVESIDHEGELRFNESIPYNDEMLAVITDTDVDIVKTAMKLLLDFNMIEVFEDGTIFMCKTVDLIGSESAATERVRKHREKKKVLHCNADETKCNSNETKCNTEKEKEKELYKDIELKKENNKKEKPVKHRYGEYKNVLLSDEDLEKLKSEFPDDYESRIEKLSAYMEMSGKTYKNYLATIRNWASKEKTEPKQEAPKKKDSGYTNPFLAKAKKDGLI